MSRPLGRIQTLYELRTLVHFHSALHLCPAESAHGHIAVVETDLLLHGSLLLMGQRPDCLAWVPRPLLIHSWSIVWLT